ncbi:hypothetical protein PsorP6_011606 [Peronosclerospora sorghi]|uniref:Uncharacterized protein n=1 Tax=Peronosclerospora sorghi TaxID=230839 RepID=A0ACC0WIR9_9STRA|nr:hypothetical protein PsorP6_011606 [Peronosclerospora sorghi]
MGDKRTPPHVVTAMRYLSQAELPPSLEIGPSRLDKEMNWEQDTLERILVLKEFQKKIGRQTQTTSACRGDLGLQHDELLVSSI